MPTENGAIRALGITTAFEGTTTLEYDADADTITDVTTGTVYTVQQQGDREFYVDEAGNRVSDQSWKANVGLDNYKKLLTNPEIRSDFISIFIWTFLFATLSVASTFILGLLLAISPQRPQDARPEGLSGDPDHALRHSRVHLAAGVVQLLQPRLRSHQRPHGAGHQLARRDLATPGRPC